MQEDTSISSLTPNLLLYGYQQGVFPMAHPEEDNTIYWYSPDPRGILPLDTFHVPKNLARTVRRGVFEVTLNRGFEQVIQACAERETTWISDEIVAVYTALHRRGYAHAVACWQDSELVGGLYGVALGGAFFGESMFHRVTDASKVALVHLVRHLNARGYVLLDTQFTTPHLEQFGCVEIPRAAYEERLDHALTLPVRW